MGCGSTSGSPLSPPAAELAPAPSLGSIIGPPGKLGPPPLLVVVPAVEPMPMFEPVPPPEKLGAPLSPGSEPSAAGCRELDPSSPPPPRPMDEHPTPSRHTSGVTTRNSPRIMFAPLRRLPSDGHQMSKLRAEPKSTPKQHLQ